VSVDREICCPSAGSVVSAHRDYPVSAVTGTAVGTADPQPADTHLLVRLTTNLAGCRGGFPERETRKCVSEGWAVRERLSGVENVSGSRAV